MSLPLYFSETFTVGKRTYLLEVRRSQRGQKYFIIKRTDLRDEEQDPVIVFDGYMTRFSGAIDRATRAMLNTVSEVEPADERSATKERSKTKKTAAKRRRERTSPGSDTGRVPTLKDDSENRRLTQERDAEKKASARAAAKRKRERPNQGKRWSEEHDSLLIVHYKNGMPTDELAELLGRGQFAIGVRLAKLGLDQPRS